MKSVNGGVEVVGRDGGVEGGEGGGGIAVRRAAYEPYQSLPSFPGVPSIPRDLFTSSSSTRLHPSSRRRPTNSETHQSLLSIPGWRHGGTAGGEAS